MYKYTDDILTHCDNNNNNGSKNNNNLIIIVGTMIWISQGAHVHDDCYDIIAAAMSSLSSCPRRTETDEHTRSCTNNLNGRCTVIAYNGKARYT